MSAIELRVQIERPRAVVFEALTDVDRWAEWIEGIVRVERLSEGPVTSGTRFKETRVMFKKEHTEEMWFDDLSPPDSYTIRGDSCGSKYTTTFRLRDRDGGTQVDMRMDCEAVSFMAKLMKPIGLLMMGPMKKIMTKDLEDLKVAIEGQT